MPQAPGVLLGGEARQELRAGVGVLADVIRRTLGPRSGRVYLTSPGRPLEVQRSSAEIARRMIALPSRSESIGAMLLRHGVWRMHRNLGDGGATTAALLHDMILHGVRVMESGADARGVETGMRIAARAACAAVEAQARPLRGEPELRALLHTSMVDDDICAHLGEIFGALGADAGIVIEEYVREGVAHEVLTGSRWEGRVVGESASVTLADPLVMVTDQDLSSAGPVARLLDLVLREERGPLVIFARDVAPVAQAAIACNRRAIHAVAVKLDVDPDWRDHLDDIAVATGATFLSEDSGVDLGRARIQDLGYAQAFHAVNGVVQLQGGAGEQAAIRDRTAGLRHMLRDADGDERQGVLRRRMSNVQGRSAVLEVGGATDWERKERIQVAHRAARLVPVALTGGVVPGGGAALVHAQAAARCARSANADQRAGVRIVHDALAAPMRWLLRSGGVEPDVVERVRSRGPGSGYDLAGGAVCCMRDAGVVDACAVVEAAIRTSVSLAVLTLTADAMVLLRQPRIEVDP